MSEQINETETETETEVANEAPEKNSGETKKKKTEKISPFLQALRDNQVEQARDALMKTVCGDTNQTLGAILDALESDSDGEYIMLETFRSFTVDELARAVFGDVRSAPAAVPPDASASADDDDELDDDDDFVDDGTLEIDDEEEEPKPKKKGKNKSKGKKKSKAKKAPKKAAKKPKAKAKSKKSGGADVDKAYQKSILGCLKENRAYDNKSGMSAEELRNEIGGEPEDIRVNIADLIEKGKVSKYGKARGTRYIRVRNKKSS